MTNVTGAGAIVITAGLGMAAAVDLPLYPIVEVFSTYRYAYNSAGKSILNPRKSPRCAARFH